MSQSETRKSPTSFGRGLRVLSAALLLSVGAAGGGCASKPEVVPTTGPHLATSPMQVKLYQSAPAKYELLGTVTVSRDEGAKWDDKGEANAGMEKARAKAAALGANGLLMSTAPGEHDYRALVTYEGTSYQVPARGKAGAVTGVMQAIYVHKE